ncbi:DNA-3-methyladenine glycosylase family protein [Planctomycetaceae bacterium SH139]
MDEQSAAKRPEILTLTERRLQDACRWLADREPVFRLVLDKYGYPGLWHRPPGFSTTVHIILEQQVSLASANATFGRLQARLAGQVTPAGILAMQESEIKELGFTRQKCRYVRLLAEAIVAGDFSFERLAELPDDAVRAEMTKLKGIGVWTADVYLSECLLRCDIMPRGDIGIQEAVRVLLKLAARPGQQELDQLTATWSPWRSAATRLLWHFYLSQLRKVS